MIDSRAVITDLLDAARRVREPVYLVGTLYVAIGFAIVLYGLIRAELMLAFLGFLAISGALCACMLFSALTRLDERLTLVAGQLERAHAALSRVDAWLHRCDEEEGAESHATSSVDLARFGRGDPSVLAAATLDRSGFLRLVASMDEDPPAESAPAPTTSASMVQEKPANPADLPNAMTPDWPPASTHSLTYRNLQREWARARRHGDLVGCRRVLSAVLDTAPSPVVERMQRELNDVAQRVEAEVRSQFRACIHHRDIAGALAAGERIVELFPDEPIAREFCRLKPHLLKKSRGQGVKTSS